MTMSSSANSDSIDADLGVCMHSVVSPRFHDAPKPSQPHSSHESSKRHWPITSFLKSCYHWTCDQAERLVSKNSVTVRVYCRESDLTSTRLTSHLQEFSVLESSLRHVVGEREKLMASNASKFSFSLLKGILEEARQDHLIDSATFNASYEKLVRSCFQREFRLADEQDSSSAGDFLTIKLKYVLCQSNAEANASSYLGKGKLYLPRDAISARSLLQDFDVLLYDCAYGKVPFDYFSSEFQDYFAPQTQLWNHTWRKAPIIAAYGEYIIPPSLVISGGDTEQQRREMAEKALRTQFEANLVVGMCEETRCYFRNDALQVMREVMMYIWELNR